MARPLVSNADLRRVLHDVEHTPGWSVEYRKARAKVVAPDGSFAFLRIGSSGFYRRDVDRTLRRLGWPPEPTPTPQPEAPKEAPVATFKPVPVTQPPLSRRDEVLAAAIDWFHRNPNQEIALAELVGLLNVEDEKLATYWLNDEWRGARHGPWLEIHRTRTRPQRYVYDDPAHKREPWVSPQVQPTARTRGQLDGPVATVLAELPGGDLLLRTGDGRIWRAAPLGTTPRADLGVDAIQEARGD